MQQKKIKVIIDSDVANEIDDQFAIAYALAKSDKLDVLGITLEPYRVSWQKSTSLRDSLFDSKNEANRLLRLFGIKNTPEKPFVWMGCDGFISNGFDGTNEAVEQIIKFAKKHKDLVICCLGTLTNIAAALKVAPEIAQSIKLVWLGTGNVLLDKFSDSNFIKDEEAFNVVVKSQADLTIFPSYMARCFVTSIYEFARNAKANNVVKYLQSLLFRFEHIEENMGLKELYDIGPVAYLLQKEKFIVKEIDAKFVVKNENVKLPKGRKVKEIVAVPRHFEVWKDFLDVVGGVKNHYLKPQIFFTSDTHFGCESKVTRKLVPFKSVEEMNYQLVKRWNNVVAPNDTVYHLGDFGDYNFVKQLNGKIVLICGNYEKEDYKNFPDFRKKLIKLGFAEVIEKGMFLDEKLLGQRVFLTHNPAHRAKDCLTMFGHVHTLKSVEKYGFNVCVTYHYFTPVSTEKAKNYLNFVVRYADEDAFS